MSDRPMRSCDVCGQIDDHPRHIFAAEGSGEVYAVNAKAVDAAYAKKGLGARDVVAIVRDLEDTSSLTRHMDCCREAGCPTGDCDNAPKKTGNELLAAITGEKVS